MQTIFCPTTRLWKRSGTPGNRSWGRLLLIVGVGLLGGCASSGVRPVEGPPLDAGALARTAESTSAVERPYRIVFQWSLTEPGARLSGTGVGRLAPPYQGRLDLYLDNNENVAIATMVGDQLSVLSDRSTRLPNAPFLWAALGVFRPGAASLQGGAWESDGVAELRYLVAGNGQELRYGLQGSRITTVELFSNERRVEELKLTLVEGERFPRIAEYRYLDPNDLRELRIVLETVEYVESYPSDIFVLP